MKVVYIEWLDASGTNGQVRRERADKEGLVLMHTAGLLISEDEQVVRLVQDYWDFEDSDGVKRETLRELAVIPKNGIQRRVEWETQPIIPDMPCALPAFLPLIPTSEVSRRYIFADI